MDFKIDKMSLEDLISIKDILTTEFDDFWNYEILKSELESNNSYFFVAKNISGEIVGFAGIKIILDEADIMNIVVKKDFINNVSHEIKTPISSIQGFAKLLEDENLPEAERKEYAEIIIEESNRLLNLSTNILRLSKIQNQGKIVRKDHIFIKLLNLQQ